MSALSRPVGPPLDPNPPARPGIALISPLRCPLPALDTQLWFPLTLLVYSHVWAMALLRCPRSPHVRVFVLFFFVLLCEALPAPWSCCSELLQGCSDSVWSGWSCDLSSLSADMELERRHTFEPFCGFSRWQSLRPVPGIPLLSQRQLTRSAARAVLRLWAFLEQECQDPRPFQARRCGKASESRPASSAGLLCRPPGRLPICEASEARCCVVAGSLSKCPLAHFRLVPITGSAQHPVET